MTKYEVTIEETKSYKFETDMPNEMRAVTEAARLVGEWKPSGEPDNLTFTVREA